jgi:RimJ/RimL family protein N-acetyltransferase
LEGPPPEAGAPFAERPGGRYLRRLGPASPSFNGPAVPRHPTLETERLLLRPWRPAEDLDALAALNADPGVMRFVAPNRPLSRAETAAQLERFAAHWDEHGFGLWAVVSRLEPGAGCVGFAGLAIPSFLPAILPAVEVGWRLTPAVWGRGLATEAARAGVAFGFERLGLRSIVSVIEPGNERSLRVAEKLGMRPAPDRLHPLTGRRLRVMELGRPQGRDARPTAS